MRLIHAKGGVTVSREIHTMASGFIWLCTILLVLHCSSKDAQNKTDDVIAPGSSNNAAESNESAASAETDDEQSNAAKGDDGQSKVADDASKEADDLNSAGVDEADKKDGSAATDTASTGQQSDAVANTSGSSQDGNMSANAASNTATGQNQSMQANMNAMANNGSKQDSQLDSAAINSVPMPDAPAAQGAPVEGGEAVNSTASQFPSQPGPANAQAGKGAVSPGAHDATKSAATANAANPNAPKPHPKDELVVQQEELAAIHYAEESHAPPADLYPVNALVYWVGYDYQADTRRLMVRILAHGKPQFSVLQQQNSAQQPELIIRFMQSSLRPKIARDINATEFLSPVAYIRMRENSAEEYVDIILTFREQANPKVFAKDGNVQLTFDLPDHYFAPKKDKPHAALAEDLSTVVINPQFEAQSDMPATNVAKAEQKPFVPDPGSREFKTAPADGGVPASNIIQNPAGGTEPADFTTPQSDESAQPPHQGVMLKKDRPALAQFSRSKRDSVQPEDTFVISSFAIGAVGQFGEGDFQNQSSQGDVPSMDTNDTGVGAATQNAAAPQAGPHSQNQAGSDITGTDMEGTSAQYTGKPILLDFNEAELYLVLQAITSESGYNFVFPEAVGNTKITLRLLNVPWDEALKAILETQGLTMVPVGQNVMRIDTIDNITKFLQSKEQSEIFKQRQIETKILVMRLSNGKAVSLVDSLTKVLTDSMTKDPRIKVSADERTNSLMVEAPEYILAKVKSIVERMDLETPQVEIEARIVEVNRNVDNTFGISWNGMMKYDPGRGLGFGSLVFPNSMASNFAVDPGVNSWNNATGNMSLKFGSLNKFLDLDLVLKMEERRGVVNVLQTNKLIVLDRENANILAGSSQFFRANTGGTVIAAPVAAGAAGGAAGGNGLSEVDFNLSLDVTPEITASGLVNMKVSIKSDSPGDLTGEVVANKNTRELNTKMSLKSSDTAVIGGIYDTKTTKSLVGIPYLMDIPLLGFLFRKTTTKEQQMELLIMITPRILSKTDNGQAPLANIATPPAQTQKASKQQNANSQNFNTSNGSLEGSQRATAASGPVAANASAPTKQSNGNGQSNGAQAGAADSATTQTTGDDGAGTAEGADDGVNDGGGGEATDGAEASDTGQ